jgi:PAS domain S-box-containing protein
MVAARGSVGKPGRRPTRRRIGRREHGAIADELPDAGGKRRILLLMNQCGPGELSFLNGGGTTGALIRGFDWAGTPLGPPGRWPAPLKTLVSLMLASNQPMFIAWGPQRTLIYNVPYTDLLGAKHPAALGADFLEVWHEIRDQIVPIVEQAFRGEPVQMDDIHLILLRRGYAEDTHFSFFYSPVHDESGQVAGLFCGCNEITAQVRTRELLAVKEERLRGVLDHMDEGFILLDRNFRLLDVNSEALAQDGRLREDIVGQTLWELHAGIQDSALGAMYRQCMADGQPRSTEQPHRWRHGRERWMEVRARPTPDGLAVFFRDVTDRRALAEAASTSAERVQLALDAGAIIGTWVWDATNDRLYADERFARSFGLEEQACRDGMPVAGVMGSIHPDDQPIVTLAIQEALERGGAYRCEYRVRQPDGTYRWIEANGHVERDAAGRVRFPGVLLDIENRRRVEAERDAAHALLRTVVEAVPGVVYAKDLQGRMLLANRGAAQLIGKSAAEFIGRTDAEFLEDAEQARIIMATDRRVMDTGQPEQVEEAVRLPDGTASLWLSTKAPMRDADGRVIGLIGSSVDISQRKHVEDAVRDSDQRKSDFLAVLSHELRNPLAPIRNALHLLERVEPGSAAATRALAIIRRQSDQLARLVDDLLDMTRISRGRIELQRARVDLNELVQRVVDDYQSLAVPARLQLVMQTAPRALWLDADPTRISQVVGNLLHNAIKFTPDGGTIELTTRAQDGAAVLVVADPGIGMDTQQLAGMFEPFAQGPQSLARSKGGLGLGLPLVKGLVEMHDGKVEAVSDGPGRGSVFRVWLPLAEPAQDLPGPVAQEQPERATRRVLIVEDNADAASTLAELLQMEGYETRIARGGRDALALASAQTPDIVLCDIGLPDMDGYAVARALRAQAPMRNVHLIALSGYAQPADRQRSLDSGFDDHLAKPPQLEQLLALMTSR